MLEKTREKCDGCVFLYVDSSKKRKRLRRKIQSQKNEINQFLKDYNELTAESISAEDAENGTFPWLIEGGKVYPKCKHFVVEICLCGPFKTLEDYIFK